VWVSTPWHDASFGCGWKRQPPDMEGSCKYIEYEVMNSQEGVLEVGQGANNS